MKCQPYQCLVVLEIVFWRRLIQSFLELVLIQPKTIVQTFQPNRSSHLIVHESRFCLNPVVCLFISEEDCTDGANDQHHGFEVLMIQALPYQGRQLDKGMNYSFCLIKALKWSQNHMNSLISTGVLTSYFLLEQLGSWFFCFFFSNMFKFWIYFYRSCNRLISIAPYKLCLDFSVKTCQKFRG